MFTVNLYKSINEKGKYKMDERKYKRIIKDLRERNNKLVSQFQYEQIRTYSYKNKINELELCIDDILSLAFVGPITFHDVLTITKKYYGED